MKGPRLAVSEWDYTRNEFGPEHYTVSSNEKVWFICKDHTTCDGHRWKAAIYDRMRGSTCPYCAEGGRYKKVCPCMNFTTNPVNAEILKEWHPTKNDKKAEEYSESSAVIVWWKCLKNPDHPDWQAHIYQRTAGRQNCRSCFPTQSNGEISCLNTLQKIPEVKEFQPNKSIPGCKNKHHLRFDFLISKHDLGPRKIAIEFDGAPHFRPSPVHNESIRRRDFMKNRFCRLNGIHLLRIGWSRERAIPEIIREFFEYVKECTLDESLHIYCGKEYDEEYRTENEKNE